MEQYQDMYSDVAERFEGAYLAFKRTYETMNPMPLLPEKVDTRFLGWKQMGMFLGLMGSVIVSGSHSIPVFVGTDNITPLTIFIGLSAFLMVEMGIVVFGYSTTEQQHKTHEDIRTRVKKYSRNGLYFIITVAVFANVINVLDKNVVIPDDALIQATWSGLRVIIFLAVGVSAPVMAFLTGEILAVDVLEHRSRHNRVQEQYQLEVAEWQEGLNRSWSSQKKKWGANIDIDSRVQRLQQPENEYAELAKTVSNSSKQLDYTQSLTQKAAIQYIQDNQSEYAELAKTVLDSNPTANKRDVAEAIASKMTGDARGYMTVMRAYKKLGIEL